MPALHRQAPACLDRLPAGRDTLFQGGKAKHPPLLTADRFAAVASRRPAPRRNVQMSRSPNRLDAQLGRERRSLADSVVVAASCLRHRTKRTHPFPRTHTASLCERDPLVCNSKSFPREYRSRRAANSSQNRACGKDRADSPPAGGDPPRRRPPPRPNATPRCA